MTCILLLFSPSAACTVVSAAFLRVPKLGLHMRVPLCVTLCPCRWHNVVSSSQCGRKHEFQGTNAGAVRYVRSICFVFHYTNFEIFSIFSSPILWIFFFQYSRTVLCTSSCRVSPHLPVLLRTSAWSLPLSSLF